MVGIILVQPVSIKELSFNFQSHLLNNSSTILRPNKIGVFLERLISKLNEAKYVYDIYI